ncbi:LysR family transcriptional regulator [Roseovarius salinarum]|uniref:LysR family transcriptional regulator n=1 Tax=Roseovarius salinarum TaxID=1981892 RepID=UPI000C32BD37|nr:LysR family transcriptional regulator [Roseovarius salinarum]
MNMTALQTFLAIVDSGSLVRASQKMNVTQSTVTSRLKSLEDELGQVLLNRQKSGTTLTPAGVKLLRYARVMAGLWRQAQYETSLPAGLEAVCTFGCDSTLWHGPGKAFFNAVRSGNPEMALSVHRGTGRDLQAWLAEGAVDVILTYEAVSGGSQTIHPLPAERLVLYSNRPVTPIKSDPYYVFVDHGADYRRRHGESYHDAGIARINFDCPSWAMDFLLENGGSAYLPQYMAAPHVARGALHVVPDAPVFRRKRNLIVNDSAARNWAWFEPLMEKLKATHPD